MKVRTDRPAEKPVELPVRREGASNRPPIAGGSGMSHVHSLRFESLEGRELLSRAHAALMPPRPTPRPAAAAGPLVLDGTLTVNNKAATRSRHEPGRRLMTMSVPVSGQLDGLGKVHGVWYESTDQYGDYLGPDTITLHGAQGRFTIAFSNANSRARPQERPPHRLLPARPANRWRHGRLRRATESGTIDLNKNAAHTRGRQHDAERRAVRPRPGPGRSGQPGRHPLIASVKRRAAMRGVLPRRILSE